MAEGGYNAVWDVYPAGGPGGVGAPHRRERVFLVAHTDSPQSIKDTRDVREEFKVSKVNREDLSEVVAGGSDIAVADTNTKRLQGMVKESQTGARQIQQVGFCSRTSRWKGWDVEPNVGRVANGVPNRVDRLKTLGNAVVPQVAYKVARMIYEYTEKEK